MNLPAESLQREFEFTDGDFEFLSNLVKTRTGINLTEAKRQLVYTRLARRLRSLRKSSFREYCELIEEGEADELGRMINAITTNLTSFFREPHHFEYLAEVLLPRLLKHNAGRRRIRIWSAGCSTGEEPYSIAMSLKEALPQTGGWDVKILATDLDSDVVRRGKNGVYDVERVEGMAPGRSKRWFERDGDGKSVRVVSELQQMVVFKQLNLMEDWPVRGPFDAIFCRNVVIYFDRPTQRRLVEKYHRLLAPAGHLFLGHSESLFKVSDDFKLIGKTIYQRLG